MVIVGIDPGLYATGYGAIAVDHGRLTLICAGDVRPPRTHPLAQRLDYLHRMLHDLLGRARPDTAVLEMVYTQQHRFANTATMMGHARGVACLVIEQHRVPLVQYPPARVKKALTGQGAATKEQVARMVARWIGTSDPAWSFDATDALALAIAHAHMKDHHVLAGVK
jgi:crossover junction endodeoxyribonuclease RuvC